MTKKPPDDYEDEGNHADVSSAKATESSQQQAQQAQQEMSMPAKGRASQVTKSGARALANLLLLEHDFRRAREEKQLAGLIVDRLSRFTEYDCALFWICTGNGKIRRVIISGIDDGPDGDDGKVMRQWGMKTAKWLAKDSKNNSGHLIVTHDNIPDRLFDHWPETVPMEGLTVTVKDPQGVLSGGFLLLKERDWNEATKIMLDQMSEAVGYSLKALRLGIHRKKWHIGKRIAGGLVTLLLLGSFFISMPVRVEVTAMLAVGQSTLPGINAPRGPAQIDLMLPLQHSFAVKTGSRLIAESQGETYNLVVERVTPWYVALVSDRRIRTRLVNTPDGLVPTTLDRLTVSDARISLPFYLLRGSIEYLRRAFGFAL